MSDVKMLKLKVLGPQTIHCSGCERTVEFTLSRLPGVRKVRADHRTQAIEISLTSDDTDLEKVRTKLDWIGYQVEQV